MGSSEPYRLCELGFAWNENGDIGIVIQVMGASEFGPGYFGVRQTKSHASHHQMIRYGP